MLRFLANGLIVLFLLLSAVWYVEGAVDPLERPSFLIWPDAKPVFDYANHPPIRLDKETYIENSLYTYGGATGGLMIFVRVCRKGSCDTVLQSKAFVDVSKSETANNVIDIRGAKFEGKPTNFDFWYPRHCKVDPKKLKLPYSWECKIHGLTMRLHLVNGNMVP